MVKIMTNDAEGSVPLFREYNVIEYKIVTIGIDYHKSLFILKFIIVKIIRPSAVMFPQQS